MDDLTEVELREGYAQYHAYHTTPPTFEAHVWTYEEYRSFVLDERAKEELKNG
jgi:phage terminase large subunit